MGLWQRAASRIRNMLRREDPRLRMRWVGPDQPAGVLITAENALDISVVWACVMAITTAIASSRWNIFSVDGEKRTKLPDDRLDYVLNVRPNPEMPAVNMREALLVQVLTWGNAYAEITRNARGDVAELWPLYSDRMVPARTPEGALAYQYFNWDGSHTFLKPESVYHLRGPGIHGLVGDNLVAHAAKSMSLAAAQERFAQTYFGNNTVIGGVLKYSKKLTTETHEKLRKEWTDKYQGPFKSNKPIILEDGMEWMPFTNDAETAQLVASRTFQIEDICRWYGVPPHKVQHLLRATFNNIEHLGIEFVRDALTPWAKRMEQEADYKCLPQRAPWRCTAIDMGWLTHGDAKSRFEAYQLGRNMGVYTVNEIRRMEGMNDIGADGETRMVPLNMTPLDQLGKEPAANADPAAPDTGTQAEGADSGALRNAVARDAVALVYAAAFDRYGKRLRAREEDLQRAGKSAKAISENLAAERERGRARLVEECAAARDLMLRMGTAPPSDDSLMAAAEAVARGEDAGAAAGRLVQAAAETPAGVVIQLPSPSDAVADGIKAVADALRSRPEPPREDDVTFTRDGNGVVVAAKLRRVK
jgi:HK97 family phage portal protein